MPTFSIIPVLFHIGKYPVYSHDFLTLLALVFGWLVYFYYAQKNKIQSEKTFIIVLAALIGWAIGSRLPLIIAYFPMIFNADFDPASLLNGKTIVGWLIGGVIGVWFAKWKFGIRWRFWNAIAPAVALGIAIWRIGCFLWSDAVGVPTNLPWGINFWDVILRHPTQLYESLFCFLLFLYFVFALGKRKDLKEGELFTVFIVAYFIFRFFVEFIRIEPKIYLWLSAYQYTAILVLIYQLGKFLYQKYSLKTLFSHY